MHGKFQPATWDASTEYMNEIRKDEHRAKWTVGKICSTRENLQYVPGGAFIGFWPDGRANALEARYHVTMHLSRALIGISGPRNYIHIWQSGVIYYTFQNQTLGPDAWVHSCHAVIVTMMLIILSCNAHAFNSASHHVASMLPDAVASFFSFHFFFFFLFFLAV